MQHVHNQLIKDIITYGKHRLFRRIQKEITKDLTPEFLKTLKTKKGLTQTKERYYIAKITETLHRMNVPFEGAGSQQSKDYRNVNGINLHIEVKKTDSFKIIFNDTLPTSDIFYIIIFTGKEYKTKSNIEPQLVFLNGSTLVEESNDWIQEYKKEVELLKNKYCRGENKKKLQGCMEVYVRPTYSANIRHLIHPVPCPVPCPVSSV